MAATEAIKVRPYEASDESFVYATWLQCYKYSSYFAKRIRPFVFFRGHRAILNHILTKPTTKTLIACSPDDSSQIFGYLVYEAGDRPVVHFVYVKDTFRQKGVARTMLAASGLDVAKLCFTHWTFPVDELIRKYPEMTYDPYAF